MRVEHPETLTPGTVLRTKGDTKYTLLRRHGEGWWVKWIRWNGDERAGNWPDISIKMSDVEVTPPASESIGIAHPEDLAPGTIVSTGGGFVTTLHHRKTGKVLYSPGWWTSADEKGGWGDGVLREAGHFVIAEPGKPIARPELLPPGTFVTSINRPGGFNIQTLTVRNPGESSWWINDWNWIDDSVLSTSWTIVPNSDEFRTVAAGQPPIPHVGPPIEPPLSKSVAVRQIETLIDRYRDALFAFLPGSSTPPCRHCGYTSVHHSDCPYEAARRLLDETAAEETVWSGVALLACGHILHITLRPRWDDRTPKQWVCATCGKTSDVEMKAERDPE